MLQKVILYFGFSCFCLSIYSQSNSIVNNYNLGNYQQIINDTDKLVDSKETDFESWYYRGLSQQALYKFSDAIESFVQAKKLTSDKNKLNFILANTWENAGNDEKALVLYQDILSSDSLHVLAKARLAQFYKNKRDWIKAIDYYSQLVKQDTLNAYFYSQLAYCTSKFGLTDAAAGYYFQAYKLNTNDFSSAKGFIGELVKQKHYEDANAYIDSFLMAFPDNLYLLKQKAFLSAIGGSYLQAVEEFRVVVELGDTSMFTCKYFGQSLYNNGNYDEAVIWLEKYLENHPDDAKNLFICGIACQKDYQYQNSLNFFDQVEYIIYNKKTIAQLAIERAHTQIAYGDYFSFRDSTGLKKATYYKLALESLLEAEGLNSDDYTIYKELGNFYEIKMKNAQLALYYYQIYYNKLDPNKIDEWHLKWIQEKLGKLKEEVHFIGD